MASWIVSVRREELFREDSDALPWIIRECADPTTRGLHQPKTFGRDL